MCLANSILQIFYFQQIGMSLRNLMISAENSVANLSEELKLEVGGL